MRPNPASDRKRTKVIERSIRYCNEGVQKLSLMDCKFARVFSKWLLQPKSVHVRKSVAISHANDPVMSAKLAPIFKEDACADIGIS